MDRSVVHLLALDRIAEMRAAAEAHRRAHPQGSGVSRRIPLLRFAVRWSRRRLHAENASGEVPGDAAALAS